MDKNRVRYAIIGGLSILLVLITVCVVAYSALTQEKTPTSPIANQLIARQRDNSYPRVETSDHFVWNDGDSGSGALLTYQVIGSNAADAVNLVKNQPRIIDGCKFTYENGGVFVKSVSGNCNIVITQPKEAPTADFETMIDQQIAVTPKLGNPCTLAIETCATPTVQP